MFCASLADVFDNEVPKAWREDLWALIRDTPNLDWLLLTKRIGNAEAMLPEDWCDGWGNVWLGATVVTQEEADRDIPKLLATPAAMRFISAEPLLGPVDLDAEVLSGEYAPSDFGGRIAEQMGPRIDWVIAGGESGPNARPMHPDWVRSLRDQCREGGVPFFFKQWGEWCSEIEGLDIDYAKVCDPEDFFRFRDFEGGIRIFRVGKKAAGRQLDGEIWDQVPGEAVAPV